MNSSNSSVALSVRSEPLRKQKEGSLNSTIQAILPKFVKNTLNICKSFFTRGSLEPNARERQDDDLSSLGDFEDPDFKMAMMLQEEEMKRVEDRRNQIEKDEQLALKMMNEEGRGLNINFAGMAPTDLNGKRSAEQAWGENDHADEYEKKFLIQKKKMLEKENMKKEEEEKKRKAEEEKKRKEEEEKRRKEEEEKNECCYCLDKPNDAVLLPCNQQIVCHGCATKLLKEKKKCPYCQKQITGVKKATQVRKKPRKKNKKAKSESESARSNSTFNLKANAKPKQGSKKKAKAK